jgi:hypothetical protein
MVLHREVDKLQQQLAHHHTAQIELYGMGVVVRTLEDASSLFLTSSVYAGCSYIPSGIRNCLKNSKQAPFDQSGLATFLTVDESLYSVTLNYLGAYEEDALITLKETLEEFAHQATEWRLYLDEKDRHDRVHVHSSM